MRKFIMWNLITLDGYFEGPQAWDLESLEYAWGEELRRFSRQGPTRRAPISQM